MLCHFPTLYEMVVIVPAVILGLAFHEFAHALAADSLGDRTARYQGRLTLNPLAHVDAVGLVMLFLAGFGWARPVPVNPFNFRGDKKRGLLLVSLAGPAANLALAVLGAVALGVFLGLGGGLALTPAARDVLLGIIRINVVLAVFNLLPVPPLDGSKILAGILPGRQEWLYTLENYGVLILLVLLFTGVIGRVLGFFISPLYRALLELAREVATFSF
ncbi:MAG: site-2 protease family protein [Desulfotomaculales bacterium]